ncbi:MAG: uL30 family ribosomal protein [Candidatus Woesearchaeota archaeon]
MNKIAVIRIRGDVNLRQEVKDTFKHLNLLRKNVCVILDNTPENLGQVVKVKDYVTWGEVSDEVIKMLFEKRGELYKGNKDNFVEFNGKKYKKYFRLNMPKKGFGTKGIKYPFNKGGALGYRGDKINDLIMRML